MKYNPMGINRDLCSLEIMWSFSRIAIEPNILVVSWEQICDNPLATMWGQILFRKNNIVSPSYLFYICLLC